MPDTYSIYIHRESRDRLREIAEFERRKVSTVLDIIVAEAYRKMQEQAQQQPTEQPQQ
jgi:hypothetical protein